jgi:uncharacterized membrane protein YqaE (UPF0057 family)
MDNRPSQKHLDRRKRVQEKQNSFLTKDIKEKSGILALTILYFWDSIIELIFRVFFATVDIAKYSYNYMYAYIFGNYEGLIPSVEKNGTLVTFRPLRYVITVLVPPLAVFMSKGLFGWFNVIICLFLCYVNYFLGIIYAFIVTMNSRYSDRYERRNIEKKEANLNRTENNKELKVIFMIIGIFILTIFTIMFISSMNFDMNNLNPIKNN